MATSNGLQQLNFRATQIEEVVSTLKSKLETVKQAAIKAEEERLRLENEELRKQRESLKEKLALAEIRNGIKQVQLPVNSKPKRSADAEPKAESERSSMETEPAKQENKNNKKKCAKGEKDGAATPGFVEGNGGQKKPEMKPGQRVDISRLDLRIGKIVEVEKLSSADNLFKKRVDLGEATTRIVVSGLVGSLRLDEMQDKKAVFLCNLKPKPLRGTVSEGLMVCAFGPEKVEMLVPPPDSKIGDRVMCKGFPGSADSQLNRRKKIWEAIKRDLSTNEENIACYQGSPLEVDGKGPIWVPTLSNTEIK